MNGAGVNPTAPLARSLGRASDEARGLALRNLVSQASREQLLRDFAAADQSPMLALKEAFAHLQGLLAPYAQGTVAEIAAVARNERLPQLLRDAAQQALGESRALPAQRESLLEEVLLHVERVLVGVGAHYEDGVARGRPSEAAQEGVDELGSLRRYLGRLREQLPGLERALAKVEAAILNLDPETKRAAAMPSLGG